MHERWRKIIPMAWHNSPAAVYNTKEEPRDVCMCGISSSHSRRWRWLTRTLELTRSFNYYHTYKARSARRSLLYIWHVSSLSQKRATSVHTHTLSLVAIYIICKKKQKTLSSFRNCALVCAYVRHTHIPQQSSGPVLWEKSKSHAGAYSL